MRGATPRAPAPPPPHLGIPPGLPSYVARVLRSLGYRTRLHLAPYGTIAPGMRRGIQLSVDGDWSPQYPAASAYIPPFFHCGGGLNGARRFCDPKIDRLMDEAAALEP